MAVLGAYAACVVLLGLYFEHLSQPRAAAEAVATVPTTQAGFPAPPKGAVVFSRELGPNALALAVVPGSGEIVTQASVVGGDGTGVSGLSVDFGVQGHTTSGRNCGPGCYRATLPASGRPDAVDVVVRGDETTRWHVALPAVWPPVDASRLVARASRAWRSLGSLSITSRLSSDPTHSATSSWRIQAPDRVAYQVQGGWGAVIIGKRRWDRPPHGRRWKSSPQTPITQPTPVWVSAVDAHVLGTTSVNGRPALEVSFFDPKTPGWFRVLFDRKTLRTLDLHMIATAHFMHETYGSFNTTPPIRPPR